MTDQQAEDVIAEARRLHIKLNVAIRREGSVVPACDGPECPICEVIAAALVERARQPQEVSPLDEDDWCEIWDAVRRAPKFAAQAREEQDELLARIGKARNRDKRAASVSHQPQEVRRGVLSNIPNKAGTQPDGSGAGAVLNTPTAEQAYVGTCECCGVYSDPLYRICEGCRGLFVASVSHQQEPPK